MQFIEKNSFDLRSAVYRLQSKESEVEFLLLPMVHMAAPEFYQNVSERLSRCDLVLLEGVKSKRITLLARSYELLGQSRRLGLVSQSKALNLSQFGGKITHVDIDTSDFDQAWGKQRALFRWTLYALFPLTIVYVLVFGSKQLLASQLAIEDLESQDDALLDDPDLELLDDILVELRDTIVTRRIGGLIDGGGKKLVALVYGAAHMRNIVRYLYEARNYRIVESEWLTVFDL